MTDSRVAGCVGLAGLGLVGSMIGLALRRVGWRVIGCDISRATAQRAQELGAVDEVVASISALGQPHIELVVVCVAPSSTVAVVTEVIAAGATAVTDVASIKGEIVAALADQSAFVGGHPMTGGERTGPDLARAELLKGAKWVLTPGVRTSPRAVAVVERAVRATGAEPVLLDPHTHDRCVALVSHLPHVAASALVSVIAHHADGERAGDLAGPGWRDTTRVASGSPGLWRDILAGNAAAVVSAIEALVAELLAVRDSLRQGAVDTVENRLRCAASTRDHLMIAGAGADGPRRLGPLLCCTCGLPAAG